MLVFNNTIKSPLKNIEIKGNTTPCGFDNGDGTFKITILTTNGLEKSDSKYEEVSQDIIIPCKLGLVNGKQDVLKFEKTLNKLILEQKTENGKVLEKSKIHELNFTLNVMGFDGKTTIKVSDGSVEAIVKATASKTLFSGQHAITDTLRELMSAVSSNFNYINKVKLLLDSHRHSNVTTTSDGFMSKEDKDKLNGIQSNANNYIHPNDVNTRHVTDSEKASWNSKPTKSDVDNRIKALIGAAPTSLDTLKELADALNNDPNFATNIINQLGKKAPSVHNHDDRYYTESECNSRFLGKNEKASSASVATKLSTARKINGVDFDGTKDITINAMKADVDWNNVKNKPTSFPPVNHNHDSVYQPKEATTFTTQESYVAVRTPARKANQYYEFWDKDLGWADIKAGELYANNNRVYHAGNKPTWNDVTGKPSTFTPSSHNHDDRYYTESEADNRFFRNYMGSVTDFNTATNPGRYYVFKEGGSIPNCPFKGNAYGSLEVFRSNDSEIMQKFTGVDGQIFTRLRNYANKWLDWSRTPVSREFESKNGQSYGYQKLPGGIIIQWGSTLVDFTSNRGNGYLYYPIAFTSYCHVTGNVGTNDYGGYCETSGTVQGDNLNRAYAEVINLSGNNVAGKKSRVNWIAIGI